jgi:hypothetical protein
MICLRLSDKRSSVVIPRYPRNVIASLRVRSQELTPPDKGSDSKKWIGDASSLSLGGAAVLFSRIYDDAADVGFVMVSERTGAEAIFALASEDRDAEGELVSYTLKPIPETLRLFPQLEGHEIVVLND